MCGLYGYITKKGVTLTPKQKETREGIIKGLALCMQERGTHSTGIAGLHGHNEVVIDKKAETASDFIKRTEFKNLLSKNNRIVIGHTRYATVGARIDSNSHPFEIGNIIGCHNGRVTDYAKVYPEATVDSEAIFYTLDKHNNNVQKTFKKLRGAFAVTWMNKNDMENLFFMVNGNPLYLIKIDELNTYFYCSTLQALSAIVGSRFSIKDKTIWCPKTDIVYKISTDLKVTKTKVRLQTEDEAKAIEDKEKAKKLKELRAKLEAEKKNRVEKGIILMPSQQQFSYPSKCDDEEVVDAEIIVPNRDIEEYKQIMNLGVGDMYTIINAIGKDGCMMCDGDIDMADGFLWSTISKRVLCMRCGNYFPEYQELLYIDEGAYADIEEDFGEHEARYE